MARFLQNKPLVALIFLVLIYIISRFFFISQLPIFTDEAIYLRWAQIALNDFDWIYISLTDGKQPLFIWLVAIALNMIQDPLIAGRVVSIGAGLLTMLGLYFVGKELFKKVWIGVLAAFFYVIAPISFIYDRLVLYDALVATCYVWALYWIIRLAKKPSLKVGVITGLVFGAGMLTKTSNSFSIYLLPSAILLLSGKDLRTKNTRVKKSILYAAVAVVIGYVLHYSQAISPFFYIIEQKNAVFVYPFNEWIQHPFAYVQQNFSLLGLWLIQYMTIPFLLTALAALVWKSDVKKLLFLLVWFIVPFVALSFFGRTIYPRYLLFMSMPLFLLAAYTVYQSYLRFKSAAIAGIVLAVASSLLLYTTVVVGKDFSSAPIPGGDKNQLLNGWPSGVGVEESIAFLRAESEKEKIFVATQGTFGLLPYALELYMSDNPNIEIIGFWPVESTPPELALQKNVPVYFIFYQPCTNCPSTGVAPSDWPLEQVLQVTRVEEDSYYTVYKLIQE